MRVYLAGPMRGKANFNFPAFYEAAKKLRKKGHIVFNPAERDTKVHGKTMATTNLKGDVKKAAKDFGFSLREALAADCDWLCRKADAIALLPDWEDSLGAQAEYALSKALGHHIIYLK